MLIVSETFKADLLRNPWGICSFIVDLKVEKSPSQEIKQTNWLKNRSHCKILRHKVKIKQTKICNIYTYIYIYIYIYKISLRYIYIHISIISNNKNNNYNSNNNDLKDGQNQIGKEINFDLNKKLVRFITHLKNTRQTWHDKQLIKNNGIYNTYHGLLSQEWIDGRH